MSMRNRFRPGTTQNWLNAVPLRLPCGCLLLHDDPRTTGSKIVAPDRNSHRVRFSRQAVIPSLLAFFVVLIIGSRGATLATEVSSEIAEADSFFLRKVQPLLTSRCVACHGSQKAEGGLRLDSREAALRGGDSGPALVPGEPSRSLLLMAVKGTHESLEMPPKDRLPSGDIAILERWISDGAAWPAASLTPEDSSAEETEPLGDAWSDHRNPIVQLFGGQRLDLWSLKPVRRPEPPKVHHISWATQELDYFVLARLEQDGIAPPAPAEPRTLARRLYFDLTGLPPTLQQVREFQESVATTGVDQATQQLVEELLGSPRFGEHFARMWLDVVRYSDSNGFDWDEFRPQAWRYRDYVVRSFNSDKPFDQFIREQLAGDELIAGAPTTAAEQDSLIATGFLRLGPHDNAAPLFDEQDRSRAELLADVTETTASAFLGLTLSCCRCHDHKYDPFSQADHYRIRAFFAAMRFADDLPLDLAHEQAAIKEHNEQLETQVKPLREKLAAASQANPEQNKQLKEQVEALECTQRRFTHGLLMTDVDQNIPDTHILFQGDHKTPRQRIEPGFLSIYDPRPATITKPNNPGTSGRRLTLADWIASPHNPLTARVFVNRVWHSLMGRPLVATPNDFGLAGSPPEDQALLDWLASEFVREGWSIKQMVRRITNTATYRQATSYTADHVGLRTPRRLTAEQLRDSLLFVSGLLTAKADGPPIWPDLPPEVLQSNPAFLDDNAEKTKGWYPSPKAEQYCRSLFLVQKRNTRVPLLESFDLPDNSTSCARRQVSTVPPQALTLLNNSLVAEAAHAMADRVARHAQDDPQQQVQCAFELALQRVPDGMEMAAAVRLLTERSLPELCRALLNVNEFVYVD